MHKPIFLNNISLYFPNKICFENFSAQIQSGYHIAIIGNNGSGKSTLLKIIKGDTDLSEGEIQNNENIVFGYVPQLIYEYDNLSGGEKFNKALSGAFALQPDVLLLDEPTNHLDLKNRKSLMTMLEHYRGTLIVVSHDVDLLRSSINTIWHIDNGRVNIFTGKYDDYRNAAAQKRLGIEDELRCLKKEKKESNQSMMKEQQRAAKSKQRGEKLVAQKRWLPVVGGAKQNTASKTTGNRHVMLTEKQENLNKQLSSLRISEILKPKFLLTAKDIDSRTVLSLSGASVSYADKVIVKNINFSVSAGERIAITGDNGSGKTTIFKAVLGYTEVTKKGVWDVLPVEDIGYLDQYYDILEDKKTVLETIAELLPQKTHAEIRDFLNDFLFRKNEDVNKQVSVLSGGEKARLSLAKIAAKTPKLLLIDEITNNIDIETKEHVTEVLRQYPGAMIIISHDNTFLKDIGIEYFYKL
ncbi:MAG: ATP-binding cassette domain-containing protein [Endomicrobium sp.]|jgi:ATPase subunit of ABC transporter with duplicated ATPase domains|nr:ATP-binding cassette domain-containing protein [Endomicrobium sp.]